MKENLNVRPAPGVLVRMTAPASGHVPADGAVVPNTGYYRRRVRDGDLVEVAGKRAKSGE